MVRSLWTAASGMIAQQTNVDVISNNLANVNTNGYKKQTAEFKSLLYQNIQDNTTDNNGDPKPISAQVGLGVRNAAVSSIYTQGALTSTGNDLDFAIEGDGFFTVQLPNGRTGYTRSGSFSIALVGDGYTIATSDGYSLIDTNGNPVVLGEEYPSDKLSIDEQGRICFPDEGNNPQPIGIQLQLVQFSNPGGLQRESNSILTETIASGGPIQELDNPNVEKSDLRQGYLEASNVQSIDEMVNLIVAQRAYEMNSKIITASDEMMQQANNLR